MKNVLKKKILKEEQTILFFHKEDLEVVDYELVEKGNLWVKYAHKDFIPETAQEITIPFESVCESMEQQYGDDFYYNVIYNRDELQRLISFRHQYWDSLKVLTDDLLRILKEELVYGNVREMGQANLQGIAVELFFDMQERRHNTQMKALKQKQSNVEKMLYKLEVGYSKLLSRVNLLETTSQKLAMDTLSNQLSSGGITTAAAA